MTYLDRTLDDNNRRSLDFRQDEVKKVLPAYFQEEYPNLIKLLEYYYEFMDTETDAHQLKELYRSRDITQVDEYLLRFIEDELLLGQSYFEGFINKREAAKFSNLLYRSKGSLYSIQQFFRAFFGEDPTVVYTKEKVFKLNESQIGAESDKFITDDKLYQQLAIQIRTGIPISTWLSVYKLFVHPAGMYIGGAIELVSANAAIPTRMPELIQNPAEGQLIFNLGFGDGYNYLVDSGISSRLSLASTDSAVATSDNVVLIEPAAVTSTTIITEGDQRTGGGYDEFRMDINSRIEAYGSLSINDLDSQFTLEQFFNPDSVTFDDSSGKGFTGDTGTTPRMSDSDIDTTGYDAQPGKLLVASRFDQDWFRDSATAGTYSI